MFEGVVRYEMRSAARMQQSAASREMSRDKVISKEMKERADRKHATVVETRAAERFRQAHIRGALSIPPEKIKELAAQLLPQQGR
jgi:rhodanese-related sulfurtransferase